MRVGARILVTALLGAACFWAHAQGVNSNGDVVKLIKAGLSESIVLQAIDGSTNARFDTSATGLVELKKGGASDAVIQRIMAKSSGRRTPPSATTGIAAPSSPAIGNAASSGGKCLEIGTPPGQMAIRDESEIVYVRQKTPTITSNQSLATTLGSHIAHTFSLGAVPFKMKTKMVLDSPQAALRLKGNNPVIAQVGVTADGFPEETMAIIKLATENGGRWYAVGEASLSNAQTKATVQYPPDIVVPIEFAPLQKECSFTDIRGKTLIINTFSAKLKAPLPPGEYAFVMGFNMVFDFGVDGN